MSHKANYMEGLLSKTAIGSGACGRSEFTSWGKLLRNHVRSIVYAMFSAF